MDVGVVKSYVWNCIIHLLVKIILYYREDSTDHNSDNEVEDNVSEIGSEEEFGIVGDELGQLEFEYENREEETENLKEDEDKDVDEDILPEQLNHCSVFITDEEGNRTKCRNHPYKLLHEAKVSKLI